MTIATNGFHFSEDVMTEILVRLPVKSLLRFKCVSKSWYHLIKNPSFTSNHLKCASSSSSNNDSTRSTTIIKHWNEDTNGAFVSFLSRSEAGEYELSRDVAMPFFDYVPGMTDVCFYGSCHGIICLFANYFNRRRLGDKIALWNPATREIKRLLPSNVARIIDDGDFEVDDVVHIGFGFDTTSNDYKVVRITTLRHRLRRSRMKIEEPLVEVYSANTDSWRQLHTFPPRTVISDDRPSSPYLNGFCYWCAHEDGGKGSGNGPVVLLSFDFVNEVFDVIIPLPSDMDAYSVTLVNVNETIALAGITEEGQISVWVLNIKLGDGEKKQYYWSTLYTFMYRCARLMGLFRGGEVLMLVGYDFFKELHNADDKLDDKLVLCDPNTQHSKTLREYDFELYSGSTFQMVNYVESLVSFTGAYELHPHIC